MKDEIPPMSIPERSAIPVQVWLRHFKVVRLLPIGVGCLSLAMGLCNIVAIVSFNMTAERAEEAVGRDAAS